MAIDISDNECHIRVKDRGAGFDPSEKGIEVSGESSERGRGLYLMRAVVDDLSFVSEPESGTIVHLVKKLRMAGDSWLSSSGARPG